MSQQTHQFDQQQQYGALLQNLARQPYPNGVLPVQQQAQYPTGQLNVLPAHHQQTAGGDANLHSQYISGLVTNNQENVQSQTSNFALHFNGLSHQPTPGVLLASQPQLQSSGGMNQGQLLGQQNLGNYLQQLQGQQPPQQQQLQQPPPPELVGIGAGNVLASHQYAMAILNQQQTLQQQLQNQQFSNQMAAAGMGTQNSLQQLQQRLQPVQSVTQQLQGSSQAAPMHYIIPAQLDSNTASSQGQQSYQQMVTQPQQAATAAAPLFQTPLSSSSSSFFPTQQQPVASLQMHQTATDAGSSASFSGSQVIPQSTSSPEAPLSQSIHETAITSNTINAAMAPVQSVAQNGLQTAAQQAQNNVSQTSQGTYPHNGAHASEMVPGVDPKEVEGNTELQQRDEAEEMGQKCASHQEYFAQNEKLQHQCIMLDYKVKECTNEQHKHQVAAKDGKSGEDDLAGLPCMEHHDFESSLISDATQRYQSQMSQVEKGIRRRPLFEAVEQPAEGAEPQFHNLAYDQFVCKKASSKKKKPCTDCGHCHSEMERLYHPAIYKTQPCQDMGHIQIKIYQQNGMQMASSKFTHNELHSYMICPHYHDEVSDQRCMSLVSFYMSPEGQGQNHLEQSTSSKSDDMMKQFEELPNSERLKVLLSQLKLLNSQETLNIEQLGASIKQELVENLTNVLMTLTMHKKQSTTPKCQGKGSPGLLKIQNNDISPDQNPDHDAISNRVESLDESLKEGIQNMDMMKNYPLSENGFDEDNHNIQNHEVSKQLLQIMNNLEVDIADQSQGRMQSNSVSQQAPSQAELVYQNTLLKMQLMQQKSLAKASKVQLIKSFNKQYPQGKNIKPCNYLNIETEIQKITSRINQSLVKNQVQNQSPDEHFDNNSIISKGKDNSSLQQISIVNHNQHHISAKKLEEKKGSNSSSGKRGHENSVKSMQKGALSSAEPTRSNHSSSLDVHASDPNTLNKSQSHSQSDSLSNKPKKESITNSKHQIVQSNQKKRSSQKREKIFIGIYSSYLSLNKSYSRDRGKGDESNQKAHEKQITNVRMEDSQRFEVESLSGDEREGNKEQSNQKQGISQIIKYIDLSKFKIEKCKNQAQGRQHNIKHCRYFHTLKDRRRLLDFDFMSMGIDEIIEKAALLTGDAGKHLSLKQNADEYVKFSAQNVNYLMEQIYLPDLCDHQNTDKCPNQDNCQMSHNRVESVYHPEKYKSKYCTKYPKNLSKCEYGDYCSFAHSTKELKTRLIHKMTKDADFYMFYFKTEWCPFNKEHNKAQCVYAHNWQDFRRKPNIFNYNAHQICDNWKPGTFIAKYHEGCPEQASCKSSHGWKEQEYHPMFYKTMICEDLQNASSNAKHCQRGVECPYYHSEEERREPVKINQRRERPDFFYDKILEMSMNLSNINQLQELILIKVSEQYYFERQQRQYYLENKVTRQHTQDLINNGVFRNITLFCMLSKKVLPSEQFVNHIIFKSLKERQNAPSQHQITKFKKKQSSSSIHNVMSNDSSSQQVSNSPLQLSRQQNSQRKPEGTKNKMEPFNQKQTRLQFFSSKDSFDGDSNSYNQSGSFGGNSFSPCQARLMGSEDKANVFFGDRAARVSNNNQVYSSNDSQSSNQRAHSRSSFHSKHSINSETPSNYGRLDQPQFTLVPQAQYNTFNPNCAPPQPVVPLSQSHSPPALTVPIPPSNVQQQQWTQQLQQSRQGPPAQHVSPPASRQTLQPGPQQPSQSEQPGNQALAEVQQVSQALQKSLLAHNDEMPTEKHYSSNQRLKEDSEQQEIVRPSNSWQSAKQQVEQDNQKQQNVDQESSQPKPQASTGSIFRSYFNNKFQGEEEGKEQDLVERMSIQPTNQDESIEMADDQFRFKKFNSQRFDPKLINMKTIEFQLNSLLEEFTQDGPSDLNQEAPKSNARAEAGAHSQFDGQLSIFSGLAQNQIYENLNDKLQQPQNTATFLAKKQQPLLNAQRSQNDFKDIVGSLGHQNSFNQQSVGKTPSNMQEASKPGNPFGAGASPMHMGSKQPSSNPSPALHGGHQSQQPLSQANQYPSKNFPGSGGQISSSSKPGASATFPSKVESQKAGQSNGSGPQQNTSNEDDPFFYDENIVDQKTHKYSVNKN